MTKLKKLTDDEIKESSHRIAKSLFREMKGDFINELRYIYKSGEVPDPNDIVHLTINFLSFFDANVLVMARNNFKLTTKSDMDFPLMMHLYFQEIMSIMNDDEQKRLKEKMN